MNKLKDLREKRAAVFGQIDELRLAADGRAMTAEEQAKWDALLADYEKADKQVEREERFREMEKTQMDHMIEYRRPSEKTNDFGDAEYRAAFIQYLVSGEGSLNAGTLKLFEQRAGLPGVSGGVLVPKMLADKIEVALKSYGGMFEAGTMFQTAKGGDFLMPTVNDTDSKACIVTEYSKSSQSAPVFGGKTMKAYTYRTPIVPLSIEIIQDSGFDLDALIAELLADSFGRGINADLTRGDGNGRPEGIIRSTVASDATPASTAIKLDDLIDLVRSVDSGYAKRGRFMFNKNVFWELVKIKDGNGRYIWQEEVRGSAPPAILGKGYVLNDDMPDIGPGNASVLFGDFSKYYIRLVRGFRVIRLNELLAEYLSVGMFGFARVDGVLLDAGTHPIKKLVHPAS